MKLLRNAWIEVKCWAYWIFHVILIQFESIGWWYKDLKLKCFQEKCSAEEKKEKD